MISPEKFYGGAVDLGTLSDDYVIKTFSGRRVVRVGDPNGFSIELPSTIDAPRKGGVLCYILNEGGTSMDVDSVSIAAGKAAVVMRGPSAYRIAEVDIL